MTLAEACEVMRRTDPDSPEGITDEARQAMTVILMAVLTGKVTGRRARQLLGLSDDRPAN